MDIEAQLAKASVKRIKRRQRSFSYSEADSIDESANQSSHNASKEVTNLNLSNQQFTESICDDSEHRKLTDFHDCSSASINCSTINDKKLDTSDFSAKEDFSADKDLNLHDSSCHLKEKLPPHKDSPSFDLLVENVSEVIDQETGVQTMESSISSKNERSIGRTGNLLEMNDEASADVKDENSVLSDDNSSAFVTIRRKPKVEATIEVGPNKELSAALQRRSHYLDNLEVQTSDHGNSEANQSVFEYEKQLEKAKVKRQHQLDVSCPVIVNKQLSKILQERKFVIDSSASDKLSCSEASEFDNETQNRDITTSDDDALKSDAENVDLLSRSFKKNSDFSVQCVTNETQEESCLSSNSEAKPDMMNDLTLEIDQDLIGETQSSAILQLPSSDVAAATQFDGVTQIPCDPHENTDLEQCASTHPKPNEGFGLKSIDSESFARKSSWTPMSSNVLLVNDSPRQRTQPVTSKEVEEALHSSSLSPGLNSFCNALNYKPETELSSEDHPRSRGILKFHDHERAPLKGILKHPSDHRDAPIKGILKNDNPQSSESESRNIHGILKHNNSGNTAERQHHSILKREKETLSSQSQNTLRAALKSHQLVDGGEMADKTPLGTPKVSVVIERASENDSTSESSENKTTETVSGRTEDVEVMDVVNDDAFEMKDDHEDYFGEEIQENKQKISPDDVEQDSFPETFDIEMNANHQRPDVSRSVSHSRHLTEPTTSDEILEAEIVLGVPDIKAENITPKSSVTDRLAALQKSGENWKHRVDQHRDVTPGQQRPRSFIASESRTPDTSDVVRRIKLTPASGTRPESIADRLSLLTGSQKSWKSKVPEKDTKMFTVEGKMSRQGIVVEDPFANQPKRPIDTVREHLTKIVAIEITPAPNDSTSKEEEVVENVPIKVEIPKMDEKLLDEFFKTSQITPNRKIDVTVDDFDHIFMTSNDVLKSAKKVLPRRTKAGSRNPLKTMSAYITLQQEYTEEKSGIAEKEFNRLKRERVIGTPQLAQEALAGLASKENFSKVSLRKAGSFHGTGLGERHLPYRDIMLLRVKGRKWCQTRLVKPHWKSINSGDCFVLVTPDIVYHWIGLFSNIIEKNKSSDVANQIWQRHDLGVRPASQLAIIDAERPCPLRVTNKFWAALGAEEPPESLVPGHDKEDDWYEDTICLTNRVYCLQDDKLCLVPEYSGKLLKHEILRTTEVYVLDFGSEMYVWIGKLVDGEKRRNAVKVAFEFWRKGYDYKDCSINPLSSVLEKEDDITESGLQRPQWTLFGKVNQNMETILFKEKFINWPDASRLIKVKDRSSLGDGKVDLISDLTPFDAKKMIELNRGPVSTILEGSHVGRGRSWEEMEDGIKREFEIRTAETDVWHVTEFSVQQLDPSSFGQFHCEDTYVVRWKYSIHQIARTLKGQESKQALTGRTRCAYFFWQGRSSSVTEKGASALMTVELDTERGPQMQISQSKEPPCFLSLFNGHMIVHLGKRSPDPPNGTSEWKQFVVRNEMPNEICLVEIPVSSKSLRSRTSFLLLNVKTGAAFVWHGAKSSTIVREGVKQLSTSLEEKNPKELGLATNVKFITASEICEGAESGDFWAAVGGRCSRASYGSLLDDPRSFDYNSRLFFMTSISGAFEANEIHSSVANDSGIVSAYPFTQEDLYIEEQPALFLLDNHRELFLWQGWWPVETADSENVHTGSAEARFNANRKCAMETAISYAKEISKAKPPPVYLVHAGCEPIEFSCLFPVWRPDKRVVLSPTKKIPASGSLELVCDVLAKLLRKNYTFDELQERPLPDGVDPLKLETYLGEEEFERIVGMKRKEFIELQIWKQTELKQKVGLF